MDVSSELRHKIIELYKCKNFTLTKLATESGVTRSTLDSFLGKKRKTKTVTIRTLLHICDALKIQLKDLFNYDLFKEFDSSNYPKSKENKGSLYLSNAVRQRIINIIVSKDKSTAEKVKLNKISNDSKVNYSTVRRFMKGKKETITIGKLYEICKGMEIDLYDFFDDPLFFNVKDETERKEPKKLTEASKKLDAIT